MSLNNLLNISKNSLAAHQYSLGVTGANIANVNTPGYSRQRPMLTTLGVNDVKGGNITLSVGVTEVKRIYENHVERQVIDQTQKTAFSTAQSDLWSRLEGVFEESQGGRLADELNRFWQSWDDLSLNPSGWVERRAVITGGEMLARSFRDYAQALADFAKDMDQGLGDSLGQVNTKLAELADINRRVMETAQRDGSTNHLFDKRLEILKDISKHIQFDYHEDNRGAININLANGMTLVSGIKHDQFQMDTGGIISLAGYAGHDLNPVLSAGGQGKVASLLDFRDKTLPQYVNQLNELAASLSANVNAQHRLGFEAGGNPGGDFFNSITRAQDMSLAIDNPERVAASATVSQDGENARLIAALGEKAQMGATTTYAQFWSSLVARVGTDTAQGKLLDEHRQLVLNHLQKRREEVSGVSIDEEMISLMKYQMGYNAAAQLVKTADELLESLIRLGS